MTRLGPETITKYSELVEGIVRNHHDLHNEVDLNIFAQRFGFESLNNDDLHALFAIILNRWNVAVLAQRNSVTKSDEASPTSHDYELGYLLMYSIRKGKHAKR